MAKENEMPSPGRPKSDLPDKVQSRPRTSPEKRLTRVTINLTPKAAQALDRLEKLTKDTRTDTINRALQVYAVLEEVLHEGGELYIRPKKDSDEYQQLKIL